MDQKALEDAKRFFFGDSFRGSQSMPMSSESFEEEIRTKNELDKALAGWPGGVNIPRDPRPRLIKRQLRQSQGRF